MVAIVGVRDTSIPYYYHAAATGTTLLCSFFTTAAISVKVGRQREEQQCEMKKDDEVEYELFVLVVSIYLTPSNYPKIPIILNGICELFNPSAYHGVGRLYM